MSDTAYGFGAGIFFLAYAACEIPSNLLLVRFGARLWIARIMITWGLISAGMMFVQGELSFYVMRLLLGAAEAGFLPGIVYYLSQWFPRRATRQGGVVVHDRHSAVHRVRRAAVRMVVRLRRPPRVCMAGNGCSSLEGLPGGGRSASSCWDFSPKSLADAKWLDARAARLAEPHASKRNTRGAGPAPRERQWSAGASDGLAARRHHVLLPDR